ncbi:MAG TPA: ATP synthase F1 subunit epsilon [Clostridia bacterium]|nr:ATP synthase F1 subunit epsilon [Clostridia bacterium]HPZ52895.1 ATP synthase F1 subunit epsilon [Clostridia bacterium]
MNTFNLRMLAVDRPFYSGPCESIIVPTPEGKYGIMANHLNMVIAITPGALIFRIPDKENEIVAVSHGFVKVENNNVLVLVDSIERAVEIDVNRAKRAAAAAKEAILQNRNMQEYLAAQARLARALNRLRVKGFYDIKMK